MPTRRSSGSRLFHATGPVTILIIIIVIIIIYFLTKIHKTHIVTIEANMKGSRSTVAAASVNIYIRRRWIYDQVSEICQ